MNPHSRKINIILNLNRSGGTLLTRILGMLPDVVICSEINASVGVSPDNDEMESYLAIKQQMKSWYNISLRGECFIDVIKNLFRHCQNSGKHLLIRDWTQIDFRKSKLNCYNPSYCFSVLEQLNDIAELNVFAFVRNAIDVYISSLGDLADFGREYLIYSRKIVDLGVPIIKYEDLVRKPDDTVKAICDINNIQYSDEYKHFYENLKCTGDIQLGKQSRGMRQKLITELPRKWVNPWVRTDISGCKDIIEANKLLGYPEFCWGYKMETFIQMFQRKIIDKLAEVGILE